MEEDKPKEEGEKPTPEISKTEADLVREARLKLKEENDALEAEKLRGEQLRAEGMVAGRSLLTPPPKELTEDEKWAERARERYKGTGMDPTL